MRRVVEDGPSAVTVSPSLAGGTGFAFHGLETGLKMFIL